MEIYQAGITYYWKSIAGYGSMYGGYQTETVGYYKTKEKAEKKLAEHINKRKENPDFQLDETWVKNIKVE